jgi:hypothetical protein
MSLSRQRRATPKSCGTAPVRQTIRPRELPIGKRSVGNGWSRRRGRNSLTYEEGTRPIKEVRNFRRDAMPLAQKFEQRRGKHRITILATLCVQETYVVQGCATPLGCVAQARGGNITFASGADRSSAYGAVVWCATAEARVKSRSNMAGPPIGDGRLPHGGRNLCAVNIYEMPYWRAVLRSRQHKFLEHIRSQMFCRTFAPLALFNAQHHAVGIDIGDLQ